MLGLLFAAALACPSGPHACDGAPAAAYYDARAREDRRSDEQRYEDQRYENQRAYYGQDYGPQDNGPQDGGYAYDQASDHTVVRETTTADGTVRETWGPNGYVRETFGRDAYADSQQQAYQDDRDYRGYQDYRANDRAPGVYDRYGAPYQPAPYYGQSNVYSSSYDPNCNCDCPPGVVAAPVAQRETVDIRGWGLVGGVAPDGDYYSGGGGGGGYDMNGLAYGTHGSGLGGGAGGGGGFGGGSARASASASASASVRASVGVRIIGGGGSHGGGGGGCNSCSTGGSHGGGKH